MKIQNNVSIYDNVILEDDVFCGPSMVFTNVSNLDQPTPKHEYQTTLIKKVLILSKLYNSLRYYYRQKCFIGAGSVITKNVKDYALYTGVPVKTCWMDE